MADSNSGYAILDGVFTVDARQDLGSKQRCENRLQELVEDGGDKKHIHGGMVGAERGQEGHYADIRR